MGVAKVYTYTNIGLEGHTILIEVDSNKSLPGLEIIGLPDAAIKEAKERMRMTFKNTGIKLPNRKIVLNLAPSHIKKVGTRFDLAMATAIVSLTQDLDEKKEGFLGSTLFFGELGLDGTIKKVEGLLPSVISAYKKGRKHFVVPEENKDEISCVPGITIYSLTNFLQIVHMFQGVSELPSLIGDASLVYTLSQEQKGGINFSRIKGHATLKRALTIAAAGMHNSLLVGPPGSGKTMLAKALPSILPPLQFEEILQVSQIYSLVGALGKEQPLITHRPCRVVHHTASKIAIVGGGKDMRPGEISLAHLGLLFFDELAEFPREVLEVLRQPIEDKKITISRAHGSVSYPSDIMFFAAMNPCKCGFYKDPVKACSCSFNEIKRYQSKISGPLLDRFDMILEVPRQDIHTIMDDQEEQTSEKVLEKVLAAFDVQQKRYKGESISTNAQLSVKNMHTYISLCKDVEHFLKKAVEKMDLSARVVHRTIKLARTIADIEQTEEITQQHIAEALQYRSKTMFLQDD